VDGRPPLRQNTPYKWLIQGISTGESKFERKR
jgi:hypothetical protein